MNGQWHRLRIPLGVFIGMTLAFTGAWVSGYRMNLTPSEPVGLWQVQTRGTPTIGDYALFCPPVRIDQYPFLFKGGCPGGSMPFLKRLVAGPGALIHETAAGVWINGRKLPDSKPKGKTLGQNPIALHHWQGTMRLSAGEYWTYGSGDPALSFDSRYWGPISVKRIKGLARPVIIMTWPGQTSVPQA